MSPGRSPPNFRNASFRTAGSGTPPAQAEVFYERVEDRANQEVPDPEPDEMTGIVMKGPSLSTPSAMNYQSTATTESSVARTRKNGSAATMPRSNTGRRREGAGASGTASGNGNGCDDANGNGYASNKEAAAWWKTQLAKFGSIELENKGSVARDHLALGWFSRSRPAMLCTCDRQTDRQTSIMVNFVRADADGLLFFLTFLLQNGRFSPG